MTLSLHKPTAMADIQATNKKSQPLNANDGSTADLANDTELNTPESSFSQLFSLINNGNKIASKDENKNVSAASNSKVSVVDTITPDTLDEPVFADELSTVIQDDNKPQTETNDDFLARLGQSSMLLQGHVATEPVGLAQNDANGNELLLQAGETNIASTTLEGMPDLATIGNTGQSTDNPNANVASSNGKVSSNLTNNSPVNRNLIKNERTNIESVDSELGNTDSVDSNNLNIAALSQGMQMKIPSMEPSNPDVAPAAMSAMVGPTESGMSLSEGDSVNKTGLTTKRGLRDRNQLDTVNGSSFTATLADVARGQNTPFGQDIASVNGTAGAVTESNTNSTSDLQTTSPAEPVEQLDFAQIMASARKPEPLEPVAHTMTKPQVLTDAEQQVLDKRVHLNNNLASSELNEKIAIMAGKELQSATIRLDPAELGSMNIKLVVQNDQLNVTIQAQNHQSRDLLDQQMPRLREMLQQQGITLGETQVQADSGQQQQSAFQQSRQERGQENGQKNSNNEANYAIDSQTEVPITTQHWQDSTKGVDFYA